MDFLSTFKAALPLLSERFGWHLAQVWTEEESKLSVSEAWYLSLNLHDLIEFRKGCEKTKLDKGKSLVGEAWSEKKMKHKNEVERADLPLNDDIEIDLSVFFGPQSLSVSGGPVFFRSIVAVPIIVQEKVVAVIDFYSFGDVKVSNHVNFDDEKERSSFYDVCSNTVIPSLAQQESNLSLKQREQVVEGLTEAGVFSSALIFKEVEWWYSQLDLDKVYFNRFPSSQIVKHIQTFVSAKNLASVSDDPGNIKLKIEEKDSAFYICSVNSNEIADLERKLETYMRDDYSLTKIRSEVSPESKSKHCFELVSFNSRGPISSSVAVPMVLYILQSTYYLQDPKTLNEGESDLWKIATIEFMKTKTVVEKERFQTIMNSAVFEVGPVCRFFHESKDENQSHLLVAFQSAGRSFFSVISNLLTRNGLSATRKSIDSFGNGFTVYSFWFEDATEQQFHSVYPQISMIFTLPADSLVSNLSGVKSLSSLLEDNNVPLFQVLYSYAVHQFTYYFYQSEKAIPEYSLLEEHLRNDQLNYDRLKRLQEKLQKGAVTDLKINETILRYPELMRDLYNNFASYNDPSNPNRKPLPESTSVPELQALMTKITKTVRQEQDEQILKTFLKFNVAVLKTNLYKESKAAVSFRLKGTCVPKTNFPVAPYGIFMFIGSDFRGFHIRFRDVARGGLRLLYSNNEGVFLKKMEFLFTENYRLALTQQNKNKDLPEGGSKGAILVNFHVKNGFLAFKKYISALLDLLLRDQEIVSHMNSSVNELIFCGPDENTASFMDWAAQYAKCRGYAYWKAFTTGKSNTLGGIPHDTYGMTTRSVRQYSRGILEKMNLPEEEVTKCQTGGPDGDLGSNEIKLTKHRTIAIIDGSGVLYDKNGLDRPELERLAGLRHPVHGFNTEKLSKDGFLVKVVDCNVTLPTGELVESGEQFRNNFHLHPLFKSTLFVPCGGRPDAIDGFNVKEYLQTGIVGTGPRFQYIVEGANLFISQEARIELEKAGVILYKDSSANKGGVTSSSLEVLAALSMDDQEFETHMQVKGGVIPDFYKRYVVEVQSKIEDNARLEFEAIWNENEKSKVYRSQLTDMFSEKINQIKDVIGQSSLYEDKVLREKILRRALPKELINLLGFEKVLSRLPENYIQSTFAAYIASRFVYQFGLSGAEFEFFEFMHSF